MKRKRIIIISTIVVFIAALCGGGYYYYWSHTAKMASINMSESVKTEIRQNFNPLNKGVYVLSSGSREYDPIESIFASVGFDVVTGDFNKFLQLKNSDSILMLPEEEVNKLSKTELNTLTSLIEKGQNVITNGKTKLCSTLKINIKDAKTSVKEYIWSSHPNQNIKIKDGAEAYSFSYPDKCKLLAWYGDNKKAVAVSGTLGKGKFIYSAIPIASEKGASYEYYPFLMEAVNKEFQMKPAFKANNGAIYMDFGFHTNEKPSDLAQKVKDYGFDQVNVGIWGLADSSQNRYKEFIDECHRRGIKVLAWFELPTVTKDFWDKHPEWREKTASGDDAHIDWRYLMAIEDPDCFAAIQKYVKDTMMQLDWDGIDIAEIYFESPGLGFKSSNKFTPMHESYIKDFKNQYGFDPKDAFNLLSKNYWRKNSDAKNKIIESRVNLVTSLHEKMLDLCNEIKTEKSYLQVVVTMIDSISDTNMRETIGLDANAIIKLQEKYHFTMQVEDPFTLWKLGPERYKVIGENYSKLINDNENLNIDINIVDRGNGVYPISKQRGLELYQLVHNASRYTDKVIIYALCTLEKDDVEMLPYAYYRDIDVTQSGKDEFLFNSNKKLTWETATNGKTFYIDGKVWPIYSKDGIVVPKGKHKVSFVNTSDNTYESLHIEDLNCQISSAEKNGEIISLSYNSEGRCFITVNKKPSVITLEGKNISPTISELNGKYTIFLPEGNHELKLQ